jgi:hypothetical protein
MQEADGEDQQEGRDMASSDADPSQFFQIQIQPDH